MNYWNLLETCSVIDHALQLVGKVVERVKMHFTGESVKFNYMLRKEQVFEMKWQHFG